MERVVSRLNLEFEDCLYHDIPQLAPPLDTSTPVAVYDDIDIDDASFEEMELDGHGKRGAGLVYEQIQEFNDESAFDHWFTDEKSKWRM